MRSEALPWWRTLHARMVAVQTLVMLLALTVVSYGMHIVMQHHFEQESQERLRSIGDMLGLALSEPMQHGDRAAMRAVLHQYQQPFSVAAVVNRQGDVVIETMGPLHGHGRGRHGLRHQSAGFLPLEAFGTQRPPRQMGPPPVPPNDGTPPVPPNDAEPPNLPPPPAPPNAAAPPPPAPPTGAAPPPPAPPNAAASPPPAPPNAAAPPPPALPNGATLPLAPNDAPSDETASGPGSPPPLGPMPAPALDEPASLTPPPDFSSGQTSEVQAVLHGDSFGCREETSEGIEWMCAAVPIRNGGDVLGVLHLAQALPRHPAAPPMMLSAMAGYTSFAVTVALLTGWLLSRRISQPLRELEAAAAAIASGNLERTVALRGDDELTAVGRAFNHMTEELRAVLRRQQLFIANASHELRTPLTNIKLRAEALLDDGVRDRALAERYLDEIDRESERLTRLANRLLDITRAQHEEVSTPLEPVELSSHVRSAAESMRLAAERAGVELTVHVPPSLLSVPVEAADVEDAIINLLDNGIKYTAAGGRVTLDAEALPHGVRVRVSDNGRGISAEALPYVFEWFYRTDAARTRAYSEAGTGTGLGLSIVRLLVERNGGTVAVESEPGKGSCFTLEFAAA
jgi:signal transduction histidine kinase